MLHRREGGAIIKTINVDKTKLIKILNDLKGCLNNVDYKNTINDIISDINNIINITNNIINIPITFNINNVNELIIILLNKI
jgi:hypothetical protein